MISPWAFPLNEKKTIVLHLESSSFCAYLYYLSLFLQKRNNIFFVKCLIMLNAKEVAYVYCQIFIYFSIPKVKKIWVHDFVRMGKDELLTLNFGVFIYPNSTLFYLFASWHVLLKY